jgi:hypothetical protein
VMRSSHSQGGSVTGRAMRIGSREPGGREEPSARPVRGRACASGASDDLATKKKKYK